MNVVDYRETILKEWFDLYSSILYWPKKLLKKFFWYLIQPISLNVIKINLIRFLSKHEFLGSSDGKQHRVLNMSQNRIKDDSLNSFKNLDIDNINNK